MASLKFLSQTCPCGWDMPGVSRAWHAYRHLEWSWGIEIPEKLQYAAPYAEPAYGLPDWGWMIWRVRPSDPQEGQEIAYRLARLMQREKRYDFCPWPHARNAQRATGRAFYAALVGDYAGGFAIVDHVARVWKWDGKGKPQEAATTVPALRVAFVWTAFNRRRKGLASELIRTICLLHKARMEDLVWMTPLSEEGKALAFHVSGNPIYIG